MVHTYANKKVFFLGRVSNSWQYGGSAVPCWGFINNFDRGVFESLYDYSWRRYYGFDET